jgi:RNA polymerase sigma factor (sigma-70 family)
MKHSCLNKKNDLLEECDLGFPAEEFIEEEHPKLRVINKATTFVETISSSPLQIEDKESEPEVLFDEKVKELYSEPQGAVYSSLVTYFKTVSRFPLLTVEEEITLAKRIKEREEECKGLVMKWECHFQNDFLRRFSVKQMQGINEKLQSLNGTFYLFDKLLSWERARKRINRELKGLSRGSNTKQELQEKLQKVEAEISKSIAKISLSNESINKIMRTLEKLSQSKNITKKQQIVEKELRRTLREISHGSKEIKLLKNELVQANLRLVISLAKKYNHSDLTLPDLIQEGNLGLMRAVDTYDYRRGHRFITYAIWWIKQSMMRALDYQSRTIRTPVYLNEKMNKIKKASSRFLQEYKREPTLEEIGKITQTPLESIKKVIQSFHDSVSLEILIEGEGEVVMNPSLNNKTIPVVEQAIASNLTHSIDAILSDLNPRERDIVRFRFGIGKEYDHTLEEIGRRFNLSRERIRQILESALNKLRNPGCIIKLKDYLELNH